MRPEVNYEIGKMLGFCTFLGRTETNEGLYMAKVQCRCGTVFIVDIYSIKNGRRKYCSNKCLSKEKNVYLRGHGQKRVGRTTSEYYSWIQMKTRCYNNKDVEWHRYGGRGIKVWENWLGKEGFANFFKDMGSKPTPQHTIDRYPNNARFITYNGETKCVTEWAEKLGFKYMSLLQRLNKGWSIEKAFTEPIKNSSIQCQ